ncbi:MAG: T9SS type A sorting domain-containing protein [Flavobacteriales bacterium]|nr:T9SS type A sorting domain-containing protein [Flavobacteriales bacterium]
MRKNLLSILMSGALLCGSIGAWAQTVLLVQEPSNLADSYNFTNSGSNNWGADLDTIAITAEAAFAYDDGTFVSPTLGTAGDSAACGPTINRDDIEGKIAVLYRGFCNFSLKAKNVQDSGAVALIIINNIPGGPVGMGAGTNAAGVVIPVVMISDADGALLRDSILTGAVTIFLGNNTGLFANNIGAYRPNIGMAKSFSIPSQFALTDTDFEVPLGEWVFNYGSADATNVTATAVIDRDGTEMYNEVSTPADIPVGDSAFLPLPTFSMNGYPTGYYTITYTINSDETDEFPNDNEAIANFWINDSKYSKSRIDPTNGMPLGGNGLRPANETEYQWCTVMESENASSMVITGVSFATLTNDDAELADKNIQVSVFEWTDDITTNLTFDNLFEVSDGDFFDYPSDTEAADSLEGEFVTYNFPDPIELSDEIRYLTCVTILDDNVFLLVDAGIDYNTTYETHPDDLFFPLNGDNNGGWFGGGFGPDNVPAIVTNLASNTTGIAEDIDQRDVTPYPNPTVDMITIPFGAVLSGSINMEVYDVTGRSVMSQVMSTNNSNQLKVDVTSLSSGLHTFNLTFEDGSDTSFKVIITK